jgi:hypothetical protein
MKILPALATLSLAIPAGMAGAAPRAEPVARLVLEGGHDSNVLYRGMGADTVGRISPELGLAMEDHLWGARAIYGGDWIHHRTMPVADTWNHRGELGLDAHPLRALRFTTDISGAYAVDPAGMARMGVFLPARMDPAPALILRADARAGWRLGRAFELGLTQRERAVLLEPSEGAMGGALHASGIEALWVRGPRDRAGLAYRLDAFQRGSLSGLSRERSDVALAHELKGIWRREVERHIALELEAGPAFWDGWAGEALTAIPEAALRLLAESRRGALHLGARHGLSLGSLASPRVMDELELALLGRLGRSVTVRVQGAVYRSGAAPSNTGRTVGLLGEGEIRFRLGAGTHLGAFVSRFNRLDDPSPALARTVAGLRVGWELAPDGAAIH